MTTKDNDKKIALIHSDWCQTLSSVLLRKKMMRVSTCVIFKPVLIASTASVQEPLALARRCVEEIPWHGILDSTFEHLLFRKIMFVPLVQSFFTSRVWEKEGYIYGWKFFVEEIPCFVVLSPEHKHLSGNRTIISTYIHLVLVTENIKTLVMQAGKLLKV